MSSAGAERRSGLGRRLAAAAVAAATALVITGASILLFFNPVWISSAQGRASAAAATGWTAGQVDAVTLDIVLEVWFGPGAFDQEVAGEPVLDERERSHMVDVRRVVLSFFAVVVAGAAVLLVAGASSRGSRWFWRAVEFGAAGLAVGALVIGGAFLAFFDIAFTLFHQLFFAAGTWTFDPATDRLVQLFPYEFWTETSVAIAGVGLVLTACVWVLARRLAGRRGGPAVPTGAVAAGGDAS
ncbi:MAG TPA: DUF1461 domain-containing protein [Patescibacteria group bacterium]|nr:DUF1461 domain-containing protein [Patescibacteria group bacterium]